MTTRRSPKLRHLAGAGAIAVVAWSRPSSAGDPSIQKGPYVVDISDSAADIRFELSSSAPAKVEVSGDGDSGARRSFDAPIAVLHSIHATGLAPATRYAYDVRVGAVVVGAGHFATAPGAGSTAPVTFLAYGDDRSDPEAHGAVVRAMLQVPSDFVVNTGDMVQDAASAADWQSFFDVEAPLLRERPILVTVGNHELFDDRAGANFARYFGVADDLGTPRLYRTLRFGNVRFFLLNAMDATWGSGDERSWLERELARADGEPGLVWRVVVLHHGPWSVGPHGPNVALIQAGVPALLAAHHVDLLLCGHDHIYDRGEADSIKYIVTGGGGAPLYEIRRADVTARKAEATYHFVEITATGDAVRTVARRADGSLIERCGFSRGADWDCDPTIVPQAAGPAAAAASGISPGPSSARCGCQLVGVAAETRPWPPFELTATAAVWVVAALRRRGLIGAAQPR